MAKLQSQTGKLNAFGKIVGQLDNASAATQRMEDRMASAQREFNALAAETSTATARLKQSQSALDAQETELVSLKTRLDAAKSAQRDMNDAVRQATKDQEALNAARSKRVSGNAASTGVGLESGAPTSNARARWPSF